MNGEPTNPPTISPGPALPPTYPPHAETAAAQRAVDELGGAITGEVGGAVVGAAQAVDTCAAAVSAALAEIYRQAAASHRAIGDAIEMGTFSALGLAWQLAHAVGCAVDDIPAAVAQRLSGDLAPTGGALPPPVAYVPLGATPSVGEAITYLTQPGVPGGP